MSNDEFLESRGNERDLVTSFVREFEGRTPTDKDERRELTASEPVGVRGGDEKVWSLESRDW